MHHRIDVIINFNLNTVFPKIPKMIVSSNLFYPHDVLLYDFWIEEEKMRIAEYEKRPMNKRGPLIDFRPKFDTYKVVSDFTITSLLFTIRPSESYLVQVSIMTNVSSTL